MEGGQKQKVPLDSGLDVKSSDQLVPVQKPLFQHNRQKYQGSMLPTSLRYEHNGWAAGWSVYEFEVDSVSVSTVPEGYTVIRQKFNDNPAYIFQVKLGTRVVAQVWWNDEDVSKTDGLEIERDASSPSVAILSGDNNGHAFEVRIDMITGEISYDEDEWLVVESGFSDATSSSGETEINLVDLQSWVSFKAAAVLASDVMYGDVSVVSYSSCTVGEDGIWHCWKDSDGSGWEVLFNSALGSCTVNGEVAQSSFDSETGLVLIDYDTSYSGTIDISALASAFYFQVTGLYIQNLYSSSSGSDLSSWDVTLSGSSYLYPTEGDSPRAIIQGSIPYWAGLSLVYAVNADVESVDIMSVGDDEEYPIAGDSTVFSGELYFLSCSGDSQDDVSVSFYTETAHGANGQFWIGETECFDDYAELSSTSLPLPDIYAHLVYSACVFNRISISDEENFPYSIPVRAGNAREEYLSIEDSTAPWLDASSRVNKAGDTVSFEAGFYIDVAEVSGMEGYDDGWYIEGRPDLYPDAFDPSEIIGDGSEYDGYARLGFPYAYYNIEVMSESISGSMYISNTNDAEAAGEAAVDIVLSMSSSWYSDPVSLKRYYLGEAGYVLPFYKRINEDGSVDEYHRLVNVESGSSGSSFVSQTMNVTSGPLSGLSVSFEVSTVEDSQYFDGSTGSVWTEVAENRAESKIAAIIAEWEAAGWTYVSATYDTWWDWDDGGRDYSGRVYFYRYNATWRLKKGSSTLVSGSTNGNYNLSSVLSSFDIVPIGMYAVASGFGAGETTSSYGTVSFYLAACYNGLFQYELKFLDASGDGTLDKSTFSSAISLEQSGTSSLVNRTGFYIDREVSGSNSSSSFFGVEAIQLLCSSASISSSGATISLYCAPALDSSGEFKTFYIYSPSDEDATAYIPGVIYNRSTSGVLSGYNLTASALGTSSESSTVSFSVKGDAVEFYKGTSASLSWPSESGVHEFFSSCLPSARNGLSVSSLFFGGLVNSGNGSASAAQSINLSLGGEAVQILVSFALSGGVASTGVSITGGSMLITHEGFSFTFELGDYSWEGTSNSIELDVSVPLSYVLSCMVPHQCGYSNSLYYDEDAGKYVIDGVEHEGIPVETEAVGYSSDRSVEFVSQDGYEYEYVANDDVFMYGENAISYEKKGDALCLEVEAYETLSLGFILRGVFKVSGAELVSFDWSSIELDIGGTEYSFDFSSLMTDVASSTLTFLATDVRNPDAVPVAKTFAVQDTSDEYQFLRQTWNTTNEVENYWWIDSDTILELNKETLSVLRKVSSLDDYDLETDVDVDDWGGDAWETVYAFDRIDYLDNTVIRFGVTNAYGGAKPWFWTVKLASSTSIKLSFYILEGSGTSWMLQGFSITVPVKVISLGTALNDPDQLRLNTYSQLSAETIVYDAVYSATVVGEHILFGIHNDNNFNQWALDISVTGDLLQVVQGYGYVGLNGCLTGGEIPSAWFNPALGFSGTVMPVDDTLGQEEIDYVTTASAFKKLDAAGTVVGDESQQWYIDTEVSGIVSHLEWNGDSWSSVSMPLTNSYACEYGSPSYGRRVCSDNTFFNQKISRIMDSTIWDNAVQDMSIGKYYIYGWAPKVTTMLYLQQTFGQYAYVHYNSQVPGRQKDLGRENTSDNFFSKEGVIGRSYNVLGMSREEQAPELLDPVTPENIDDFSFNMHGLRQAVTVKDPWKSNNFGLMLLMMNGLSSVSGMLQTFLQANSHMGQISAGDLGRRFTQVFLTNMDNLATVDKNGIGVVPTQQSAVSTVCTLDMFYSTSEKQKISAGPGWVQHNMVAQCVAQSVTSCQMELHQIGMLFIAKGLSTAATRALILAGKITWEIAVITAELTAQIEVDILGSSTNAVQVGVAIGLVVAAAVAYALLAYTEAECDAVDAFIDSLLGGQGIRVDVQNAVSKHTYDMEGKHKYGQKSEVFMWPCFDVVNACTFTDEAVKATIENKKWRLYIPLTSGQTFSYSEPESIGTLSFLNSQSVTEVQDDDVTFNFDGDISYHIANCRGARTERTMPSDMAVVTGSDSFLPPVPFRNENISVSDPVFPTAPFQDYIIDKDWELSRTASVSSTQWIACKDTKLIDGDTSNIVVSDDFCGVACPYTAIEVKRGCEQKYIRPWAITPNALALNNTGFNACYEEKAYHAFDGYGYRLVKWCGAPGMNKEGRAWHYCFIANDRFKRSNKMPVNEYIGNFGGEPQVAVKTCGDDRVYNHVTDFVHERGYEVGVIGEDKDSRRYAAPVFSEFVSTLPAVLKTTSSFNLSVIDGITSLTSDNTDKQHAYKAPLSVDFAIGDDKYRFTSEYISRLDVNSLSGVTTVDNIVPTLGLEYLGATPYEAYLYSPASRQYYTFSGKSALSLVDMIERFRDVKCGRYDFVNQEVAMPCVATFKRLDKHVFDGDDERDNVMVPRLKDGAFQGEVWPPIETIYNMRSGFRTISLPSGLCYQGPNRCIINRFVYSGYMKEQIIENYGKWKKVPRERYHPFRAYGEEYERVDEFLSSDLVGWTHNPFLLVTSPLGVDSETDCVFEWEITFAWPVEMDELYGCKQYATVNIMGECFTPGGKVIPDRPAHVFLWKDLFTRTGNYGYYSFRYQSRCGAGNRERLHIWSDQYIAVSGLQVEYKAVTQKRTEILTQQADVQDMEEI